MPEEQRLRLRAALIESYKPQSLKDVPCGLCGKEDAPVSLHVCDFYEDPSNPPRPPAKLLGENSIGRRWSLPICTGCAPPCQSCGLPIASSWVRKALEELKLVPWGRKARIALGVCKHFHPIIDFTSRRKRPYWTAAKLTAEAVGPATTDRRSKARPSDDEYDEAPARDAATAETARDALERQFAGWDVGHYGGMLAFTRYQDQPSGFRLRVSLFPAAGNRLNLFAALIPPPDELNCDRQMAINTVTSLHIDLGGHSVVLHNERVSILGQHAVQITGWFVFPHFMLKLSRATMTGDFLRIRLSTSEPYVRQLGGESVQVSTRGLMDRTEESAREVAKALSS